MKKIIGQVTITKSSGKKAVTDLYITGLDKLEEMLVERFPDCENRIHDVFARFKKEEGI